MISLKPKLNIAFDISKRYGFVFLPGAVNTGLSIGLRKLRRRSIFVCAFYVFRFRIGFMNTWLYWLLITDAVLLFQKGYKT
jgi:hypothetical protein